MEHQQLGQQTQHQLIRLGLMVSLSCTTDSIQVQTTYTQITITLGATSTLTAGGTLQIILATVKNPVSKQSLTGIKITTYNGAYVVDTQTSGISVTTSVSGSGTATQSYISNSNTGVSATNAEYYFKFTFINPVPWNSYLLITVPSAITLPSSYSGWTFKANDIELSSATFSTISGKLAIKNIFTSYYDVGTIYSCAIYGWTNPSTTTAASFTIETYETTDGNDNAIDSFSGFSIQAIKGVVTISSIYPTDIKRILEYPSSYTFNIKCEDSITTSHYLEIIFPTDFAVTDSSACTVTGLYYSSYTCLSVSSTRTITIKLLSLSTINSGFSLSFTVNKIRNPGTFSQTGQIQVNMRNTATIVNTGKYQIDKDYFEYSTINTFSITPSSYVAGQTQVSYSFNVKPQSWVPQNSSVLITLPNDMSVNSSQKIEISCGGTISGFIGSKVYCKVVDKSIYVTKGFATAKSSSDPPTLTFTIPYLNNPRSLAPASGFVLQIIDNSNKALFKWTDSSTPTVTMKTAGSPSKFVLSRSSSKNGDLATYIFNITIKSSYQDGDIIQIAAPSPIVFSSSSECTGVQQITSKLTCTISSDYQSVLVQVATSRLRNLGSISSGAVVSISVTDVQNPPSMKPTSTAFALYAKTSTGYVIESTTAGPTITNTEAGQISSSLASIVPTNYIEGKQSIYTVSFVPGNFVKAMMIKVSIPSQISLPSSTITCKGVYGTDSQNLNCSMRSADRSVTIYDAVTKQSTAPKNITFTIDSLTNPSSKITTDSFQISTFTSDNYAIDTINASLTINFFCNYPCKSCLSTDASSCLSCYSFVAETNLFKTSCVSSCPSNYYVNSTNQCNQCQSPCYDCIQTSETCTSCISEYQIGKGNRCYSKVIISYIYPFPFSIIALTMSLSILVAYCFARMTRYLQSAIAIVSLPEIISWISLAYLMSTSGYVLSYLVCLLALLVHLLMNFGYGFLHQKIIVARSDPPQIVFQNKHKGCNVASLVFAMLISFKFHMISQSFCAGGDHLRGNWNKQQWNVWNFVAFVYILASYLLMMISCLMLLTAADQRDWVYYVSIDVVVISTYMTIMLLILMFRKSPCKYKDEQDAIDYNKVADEHSSSLMNDSQGPNTLKRNNAIKKLDDIEGNKKSKWTNLDTDEEHDHKDRRRETDIQQNSPHENQQEIDLLTNFIKALKEEGLLLDKDNKKQIMNERDRILKEDDENKHLKEELALNKKLLDEERQKLDELKREFLKELDKRVKGEDWDVASQGNQSIKDLQQTPDKSIQTDLRRHQVKDMDVDVAFENDQINQNRNQTHSPFSNKSKQTPFDKYTKANQVIKEEDNEDEQEITAREQEKIIQFNQDKLNQPHASFGRPDDYTRQIEDYYEQEEPIKRVKPIFEKIKDNDIESSQNEIYYKPLQVKTQGTIEHEMEAEDQQQTEEDDDLDEIQMQEENKDPERPSEDILEDDDLVEDLDKERDFVKNKQLNNKNSILYSDKSESSIDEQMEDTPSNYNIPNGRLDGKSLGLKAILLHAKKQGIKFDVQQDPNDHSGLATGQYHDKMSVSNGGNILFSPQNPLQKNRIRNKEEEEKQFVNGLFRDSNNSYNPADLNSKGLNSKLNSNQQSLQGANQLHESLEASEHQPGKKTKKKSKKIAAKQFKEPIIDEHNEQAQELKSNTSRAKLSARGGNEKRNSSTLRQGANGGVDEPIRKNNFF